MDGSGDDGGKVSVGDASGVADAGGVGVCA